jgi:hypothetical protein
MFKKLIQSAKIGLGVGEYQFGEKTIAARNFATTAAEITQQSMFEEAMSNISNVKQSKMVKPEDYLSNEKLEEMKRMGDYESLVPPEFLRRYGGNI